MPALTLADTQLPQTVGCIDVCACRVQIGDILNGWRVTAVVRATDFTTVFTDAPQGSYSREQSFSPAHKLTVYRLS